MTLARQAAADILHRCRRHEGFVGELVDAALADPAWERAHVADRRLLTQLVYGTIRRRATLDALLKAVVRRPPSAVEPRVRDVLRLGVYQLAFLTHVPRHAAVDESVRLAGYVGSPQARGFVNGVLRRVAELVTDEFVEQPAADAVPTDDGRYRRLARPLFPGVDSADYLALAFSYPKWLVDRWLRRYGPEESRRIAFWFNAPPPLWLRVNRLQTDRETYRLRLAARLIEAEPGEHPQSLRLVEHLPVRSLPGYEDGDFTVQDHTAMLAASALGVRPGMRVLDLCAAPGGKATHLAELMDDRGRVVACDPDERRLALVTTQCRRLGLHAVEPCLLGSDGEPPPGPFDAALVDVPCSNTGVLGRRPEARWRLRPADLDHLVRLQTRLLLQALDRVKPGGAVVYSTCSLEPEENRGVIEAVSRLVRSVRCEADHLALPGRPSDGGYWARLCKSEHD